MNSKTSTQHEELKNHVIGVLENIIELIKAEEYDQIIDKKTGYSGPNDYNFYIVSYIYFNCMQSTCKWHSMLYAYHFIIRNIHYKFHIIVL